MKFTLFILNVLLVHIAYAFLSTNLGTHLNKNYKSTLLFSKRYEIYRLRRQREILDAFDSIFTRQRGLPIGHNISPELIHGISIMGVKLSRDCSHATIYILPSGDSFQQRQCYSWVNRNSKRLRYLMAQLLKYRKNVPSIAFEPYDVSKLDDDINGNYNDPNGGFEPDEHLTDDEDNNALKQTRPKDDRLILMESI